MKLTCGQALVRLLEDYGVEIVFGIPGVHTLELYRGLANSRLRHVLVRHEQGAGFMADGYARTSGKPAACFVITGPGVTNIATPMGQAYSDSVPMLVVSTNNATTDLGKGLGRLHEITDQEAVMRPLSTFSATITEPQQLGAVVARAFRSFATERPRPVHIAIPLDVIGAEAPDDLRAELPPALPEGDDNDVARARDLLENAQRPLVIVGGGARHTGAAIEQIATTLGAATITTCAGKGIVSHEFALNLGATLPYDQAVAWISEADVVLALGTELAQTDYWTVDQLSFTGKLIRVDIDAGKLSDEYPAEVAAHCDAAWFATRLAATLKPGRAAEHEARTRQRVQATREEIVASEPSLCQRHHRVLAAMRRALPPDAILATDMTQIAYSGNEGFPTDMPNRWLQPRGFGTLGYALPAAIGARLANPDTPVVALAGDAGLLFTVQELAVAVALRLPIIVILWNNDALGQIRDDMVALDIPAIGVEGHNPDFLMLAEAFGCHATRAASTDSLEAAIAEALERSAPTLIEVRQDDF